MARRFTNSKGTGHGSNLSLHDLEMMKERKAAASAGLSHSAYRRQQAADLAEATLLQEAAAEQAFVKSLDDVFANALDTFVL